MPHCSCWRPSVLRIRRNPHKAHSAPSAHAKNPRAAKESKKSKELKELKERPRRDCCVVASVRYEVAPLFEVFSMLISHRPRAALWCTAVVSASLALLSACPNNPNSGDDGKTDKTADKSKTAQKAGTSETTPKPHLPEVPANPAINPVDGSPLKAERPPFPNMASPQYGQKVMEFLGGQVPSSLSSKNADELLALTLQELHNNQPDSERRALDAAAALWRVAPDNSRRATASSLAAAALALHPDVTTYRTRLVDAYGLVGYAGTLTSDTTVSQAARAYVAIAAGSVSGGRSLLEILNRERIDPDALLFTSLGRSISGERSDIVIDGLRTVLEKKPDSLRARIALAEVLIDLGDGTGAADISVAPKGATGDIWLEALHGYALFLEGKRAEGIALMQKVEPQVGEGKRGQVQYWLAQALLSEYKDATLPAPATTLIASLGARVGYTPEAKTLDAHAHLLQGDAAKAKQLAEEVSRMQGAPLRTVMDAVWILAEAAAQLGDSKTALDFSRSAQKADADVARLWKVRLALLKSGKVDAKAALGEWAFSPEIGNNVEKAILAVERRIHRLDPFDAARAALVGEKLAAAENNAAAAHTSLRAARTSLAGDAPKHAAATLQTTIKANPLCKVCRAVLAQTVDDPDKAATSAMDALDAKGPDLDEDEILILIDIMGGAESPRSTALLKKLAIAGTMRVRAAVEQAFADYKNPDQRAVRIKKRMNPNAAAQGDERDHGDHDDHGTHGDHGKGGGFAPPVLPLGPNAPATPTPAKQP